MLKSLGLGGERLDIDRCCIRMLKDYVEEAAAAVNSISTKMRDPPNLCVLNFKIGE